MRPGSQSDVVVPKPSPASAVAGPSKRSAGPPTVGPQAKRPRLDHAPARDKENKRSAAVNDEKAIMDDLMSGLDASMFDVIESSPVKSQKLSQRSPSKSHARLQVEYDIKPDLLRAIAPLQTRGVHSNRPAPTIKPSADVKPKVPAFRPMQREPMREIKPDVGRIAPAVQPSKAESSIMASEKLDMMSEMKEEATTVVVRPTPSSPEEEDEFDFDLDLGDLAHLDEDLLLKPDIRATPLYPTRNPEVPKPPEGYRSTPWARCKVQGVWDGLCFTDGDIPEELGASADAGPSRVVNKPTEGSRRVVHLKERWADMAIKTGDTVNIISPALESSNGVIEISFKTPSTFVIHHPDLMLTMTSIANAMPCSRKPILQSLVKASGPATKSILYGNMGHTLLQSALSERDFSIEATRQRLDAELQKETIKLDIWGAGMGVEDVRTEVGAQAEVGFQAFGDKWVGAHPSAQGELHHTLGDQASLLAISGLHDIEEDIWSPKWGLKGKVDASVQASIERNPGKPGGVVEENVAPLEIKTGRAIGVMAHRAQTMLYTLLMEDRYGVPVPAGLLYYSKLNSILRVEARPNEIRALIMARNELAGWLSKQRSLAKPESQSTIDAPVDVEDAIFLPPTIDNARECKSCYAVDSCMLYRKTVNQVPVSEDDEIMELYEDKAGHVTEAHAAFFRKWDDLLTVEEQDSARFRSQLWTMGAARREKSGRCFADMVIASAVDETATTLQKIHRHTYTFVRSPDRADSQRESLLSGHIARGDPVSISIEPDLLCMQRGFVTELTPTSVVLGLTYKIDVGTLLGKTKYRRQANGSATRSEDVRFRIDKDEMSSGIMRMRNNLAQLFYKDGDEKRRRLVVDLAKPVFEPARAPLPTEIPGNLNSDQVKAMHQVLTARDYALILGMPGTGKTTTIAEIITALVARGKSVLLTSYTHSAVDTILMKLLEAKYGILRLGNIDKVHPSVRGLTLEALPPTTSMAQMDARLMEPPVVAATCLAIDHPLFFRRKFDYCIVDEASQITLPTCLGPLRMADTFVLVGDHFQLPPIVKNAEARKGGLDVSLFKLLSETHPQAVVDLSYQYRMNEDIMLLSNRLVYENRLKCGSDQVAKQGLIIPAPRPCSCGQQCWLQRLLQEDTKAVFVDTDDVPALDSRVGDLVQNETEAHLVQQLATSLTGQGVEQDQIAVITPYRQQIKLLASRIGPSMPSIEILTADKSQGRDKDCIIISLVRSNHDGYIGDLLRDWRRINVSFTRAKKKLIIIGSARTLASDQLLRGFLDLMEEKSWVLRLQPDDDKTHALSPPDRNAMKPEARATSVKKEVTEIKVAKGILGGRPFLKEALNDE